MLKLSISRRLFEISSVLNMDDVKSLKRPRTFTWGKVGDSVNEGMHWLKNLKMVDESA